MRREAEHRGLTIAAEFSDVGTPVTNCPQFAKMLGRIQNGNPDGVACVLVSKLSRFGHDTTDVLRDLQTMQDHGVSLLSVDDGIDTASAEGKLAIAVLAAVYTIQDLQSA